MDYSYPLVQRSTLVQRFDGVAYILNPKLFDNRSNRLLKLPVQSANITFPVCRNAILTCGQREMVDDVPVVFSDNRRASSERSEFLIHRMESPVSIGLVENLKHYPCDLAKPRLDRRILGKLRV